MKKQLKSEYVFGLNTFGDIVINEDSTPMSAAESIRRLVDEAVLADKLGIDVIGIGEHHREEFAVSSPETVLAGIATKTKRIKLASAVTVLSSDDPVRVFQRFSTVDALSKGRAQVILGRGSFTESFPLFGHNLQDYNELFEEKIDLFAELLRERPVTWQGRFRPSLENAQIYPKTESGKLETLVGVGGSPQSVVRAAAYDFPVVFAIIGGSAERFAPYAELYHRAVRETKGVAHPLGVHSPGFVADTDEEAIEIAAPLMQIAFDRVGRTRGWQPFTREHVMNEIKQGAYYIGSPETVAQKIATTLRTIGAKRFDMVYGFGPMKATDRLKHVELYGTKVIPRVKEILQETHE